MQFWELISVQDTLFCLLECFPVLIWSLSALGEFWQAEETSIPARAGLHPRTRPP